jgi:serine/threonine protein kinase
MEPERWERIKRIFSAALEQDTGDRAEILRDLCGGDESLRAEVESMLARHAKEPGWLKTLGLGPGAFFSESAPTRSSPLPSADDVHEGNSDVLTNGTILGQYCITGKLGEGGMGTVYRGYDQVLRRDVAIKILRSGQREDSLGRERLLREARSAASLNHPNICTIYQVGEAEGKVYIAMELVTGQSLSQRLEDGGPLTPDETLRYSLQLADALAHAHEHGIIHRDLKCANVIVTPEQRCKVLDFGLAKRLESDGTGEETTLTALTEAGTVPGTPAYMAPEQLQGQPADARSDVWAFGVMLYEAVVGKRPFRGNTSFELISAIVNGKPAPLPSKIPIALQNVVECCLSKDPDKRHSNGRELHAALEKIQSGETNGLLALFHNRHRRRLMTGILTTVAVVALAALLVLFNPFRLRDRVASLISTARIDTVAVLPFVNLTGDRAQDSLANGMTDALITDLAQFRGLKRVIGYLSVARYKDSNLPPKEIARQLQVASLITGTVNQLEDRVTVNIQLIDPATGVQL